MITRVSNSICGIPHIAWRAIRFDKPHGMEMRFPISKQLCLQRHNMSLKTGKGLRCFVLMLISSATVLQNTNVMIVQLFSTVSGKPCFSQRRARAPATRSASTLQKPFIFNRFAGSSRCYRFLCALIKRGASSAKQYFLMVFIDF